jgi:hypothetical protein
MSVQPKLPGDAKPVYKGEVEANTKGNKFAKPFEEVDGGIANMSGLHNDIGEKSGFEANTDAYIVKKGTPYGEAAKLNIMPPGMDINDQPVRDIRDMQLKKVISESYPGDGWEPAPRDLAEGYGPKGSLA